MYAKKDPFRQREQQMQRREEEGSLANCKIRKKVKCKWNEWIKVGIVREKSEQ